MGLLGVETGSVGVAFREGLCHLERGTLRLKASVFGEAGRAPFQLCRGIRLTTEEKHGELDSLQTSSHRTTGCDDWAVF
jgi:hypothetical protein